MVVAAMNSSITSGDDRDTAMHGQSDPVYFYKPNLMGSPWVFQLRPDALAWEYGRRSGRVPYDKVQRVRMSFRPGTLQMQRFITEVWSPQSPKLTISSVSFRGLMEQARQDDDYNAFVGELHRRLAAAGSQARFEAGMHPALYWMGAALFAGIGVTLAGFLVTTLLRGDLTGSAVIAGVVALVVWQAGMIFRRNRPQTYRPQEPPRVVFPGG
jgi:hypothetical protein